MNLVLQRGYTKNSGLSFLFVFFNFSTRQRQGCGIGFEQKKDTGREERIFVWGPRFWPNSCALLVHAWLPGMDYLEPTLPLVFIDLNWQITSILSHDRLIYVFNLSIRLFLALVKYLCIFCCFSILCMFTFYFYQVFLYISILVYFTQYYVYFVIC